ncbi:UDP-Glycosyltransferase glycogen phosphorylase [Pyrrhoderma noxium]|uniref:UDP-Glycosyltransferase glycogen phosphorylase n=1 Tax=Pyrrhoderma noxium TaxID=2282107 RepID=A0A286UD25_9AGAM|nr:UDP-Glycosyltransferase glycogen phosphorylase [Pyrrhoderma noxium]
MNGVPVQGHIIALTIYAWGHVKCVCGLISKIIHLHAINATIFIGQPHLERAKKEVDSHFLPGKEDRLRSLIRIVGLHCDDLPCFNITYNNNFIEQYKKLLISEPIREEPGSDIIIPGIESPKFLILDFFLYNTLRDVRSLSGKSVPIYALQSAATTGVLFMYGPEYLGGNGDLEEKVKGIEIEDRKLRNEKEIRIYRRCYGELVKIPGLPPMYDYEFSPQEPNFDKYIVSFSAHVHKFMLECDGAIINTASTFEKPAIEAFQEWFGERPVISAGPFGFPLVDKEDKEKEKDTPLDLQEQKIRSFLDSALEKYGSHSVLYISFGSIFWFTDSSKIVPLLDVILDQRIPFILSIASPSAVLSEELKKRILNSGCACITTWAPQADILNHKATGWFISHCGHNSTLEALSSGVPMICCPFDADQPSNASNLSHIQNIAYELYELRSSHGLRPIHRLNNYQPKGTPESIKNEIKEVLKKAWGEDGKRKRKNIRRIQEAIKAGWGKDGENWDGIKKIYDIAQGAFRSDGLIIEFTTVHNLRSVLELDEYPDVLDQLIANSVPSELRDSYGSYHLQSIKLNSVLEFI